MTTYKGGVSESYAIQEGDTLRLTIADDSGIFGDPFRDSAQWLYDNSVSVVGLYPVSGLPTITDATQAVTWDVRANLTAKGLRLSDAVQELELISSVVVTTVERISRTAVAAPDANQQRANSSGTGEQQKKQQDATSGPSAWLAGLESFAKEAGLVLLFFVLLLVYIATRKGVKVAAV